MAINKRQSGNVLTVKYTQANPPNKSNEVVVVGYFVGVCTKVIEEHKEMEVQLVGVWDAKNKSGATVPAFNQGDAVYVTTAGELTATQGTNALVGHAFVPNSSSSDSVAVRLKH